MVRILHKFWKCDDWNVCMKNQDVPAESKYLFNGVRYLYSSYITNQLHTEINGHDKPYKYIRVIPTGSHNVGSDIDTQIMMNICKLRELDTRPKNVVIDKIRTVLDEGKQIWDIKEESSLATVLDINLYPATLLNYVTTIGCYCPNKLYLNRKTLEVCFRPRLHTDKLVNNFVKSDYKNTQKEATPNMLAFYERYRKCVVKHLYALSNQCTKDDAASDCNKDILGLVKYNHLADEVYLSVSAIIVVVWHQQMGNALPKHDLSVLCLNSFVENYDMFEKTKKEKYRQRYQYALDHIAPTECIAKLGRTYQAIIRTHRDSRGHITFAPGTKK